MKGRGIRGLAIWLMGAVVLLVSSGAWAQTAPTLLDVCTTNEYSPSPGTTPVTPSRWWNPARSGTGWDIHFGSPDENGERVLAMAWFSYDTQGRPTWYIAHGDKLSPGQSLWIGQLSQITWNFQTQSRSDLQRRGDIHVRFQQNDASRLAIQWRLDGRCMSR